MRCTIRTHRRPSGWTSCHIHTNDIGKQPSQGIRAVCGVWRNRIDGQTCDMGSVMPGLSCGQARRSRLPMREVYNNRTHIYHTHKYALSLQNSCPVIIQLIPTNTQSYSIESDPSVSMPINNASTMRVCELNKIV